MLAHLKRGNCTLCRVRGKLLVGGVCGRNCLIILSLLHQMPPYYCPAVITLLPFQLKSNCPPFNWNRYGTNGYKSSGFRSHETTDVLRLIQKNMLVLRTYHLQKRTYAEKKRKPIKKSWKKSRMNFQVRKQLEKTKWKKSRGVLSNQLQKKSVADVKNL